MNKSSVTSIIALIVTLVGWHLAQPLLLSMGLFALSGALTNWLAVHMLFEKVPLLYGSGVVQIKFNAFKQVIHELIEEQFLSPENLKKASAQMPAPQMDALINHLDMSLAFDKLVQVIEQSQFGSMLGMFGGRAALEPMREPFADKMREAITEMLQDEQTREQIIAQIGGGSDLQAQVKQLVSQRLDELTPAMVKEIIQTMIRAHLGWLVVWGGVFGGAFGALAYWL
ncbi:DUF445 domain-containing protein [Pseudoalteromonas sp. MM17-2]|uniref:DUF445 domain-containing protein n=1 Tax=Pseudoalteromonas sp. MM17-2 TaxID=2917753 RepID=UPI001EF695D9|nr:DUF445 domain-containing protein [Pseudoalteromonas sp. MM17-2]